MGILDIFRKQRLLKQSYQAWQELGKYTSTFSPFGSDMYASDLVRSCIRPLAEHTSKANARCKDKAIEKLLNGRPNVYMNAKDFLAKVRTHLELKNTVFIFIERDATGKAVSLYPVPYSSFQAVDYSGRLFINFAFNGTRSDLTLPWEDLAVVRKDYNKSDIAGDDNTAIFEPLELVNTTNQGIANAVKATSNLRGILKSTKAMLRDEDIKANKEAFVKDYMNLENSGGIAALDATQEFTPITMSPTVVSAETQKEFRENIYRYFGVNDAIVTSDYTEQQMEAFYDARIEPFLVALSLELTNKLFTDRERGFGNAVVYESNRLQFTSTATKLAMVSLVDRGALTPNEWRMMFNLSPVDGGDVPIRRLDTAEVNNEEVTEEESE